MNIWPWVMALLLLPSSLLAHVPVPVEKVPRTVIEAAGNRTRGMEITEAAVDVGHSSALLEDIVVTYVLKGKTAGGKDIAIEVTAGGMVLQIWDREYYEEYVED